MKRNYLIDFICALLIAFGLLCIGSCKGQDKNRAKGCREEYLALLSIKSEYITLRKAFNDSLALWLSQSRLSLRGMKLKEYDGKLDEVVFFSKDSTRAILFFDKIWTLTARFDEIKAFTAVKSDGKWLFDFKGHVSLALPRISMEAKHTWKELSEYILPRFADDGLEISSDCKCYYPVIETDVWFKGSR